MPFQVTAIYQPTSWKRYWESLITNWQKRIWITSSMKLMRTAQELWISTVKLLFLLPKKPSSRSSFATHGIANQVDFITRAPVQYHFWHVFGEDGDFSWAKQRAAFSLFTIIFLFYLFTCLPSMFVVSILELCLDFCFLSDFKSFAYFLFQNLWKWWLVNHITWII